MGTIKYIHTYPAIYIHTCMLHLTQIRTYIYNTRTTIYTCMLSCVYNNLTYTHTHIYGYTCIYTHTYVHISRIYMLMIIIEYIISEYICIYMHINKNIFIYMCEHIYFAWNTMEHGFPFVYFYKCAFFIWSWNYIC